MKKQVIKAAGEIWKLLDDKGEVNVAGIPRLLKGKGVIIYQGLGWLAREDKIHYRTDGDKVFVSLTDSKH